MEKSNLNIVLYQPVIPQNTGSIARLCACIDATLHLIHPLGFSVDEASVRRAGLDYWPHVKVKNHESWESFLASESPNQLTLYTKFATKIYTDCRFTTPTYLVFGSETKGLPEELHSTYTSQLYKIPMRTSIVRSLNLAQSAAIVAYEVIRQNSLSNTLN